ncbi:hypothetical protein DENIT_40072 [Pseudomonas veronii]|nr:hypothetical protein DENIT_20173 [Pseudomonas veronii]CAD0265171.1 hypothetical protein DENIT_40072 [Pseudomonas veronii]
MTIHREANVRIERKSYDLENALVESGVRALQQSESPGIESDKTRCMNRSGQAMYLRPHAARCERRNALHKLNIAVSAECWPST